MKRNKNQYINFGDETVLVLKSGISVLISTVSVALVKPYTWCREGTGYIMSRSTGKAVKLHRLIMDAKQGDFVDHIDGDPLNNTLANLRRCTKQQNEFNQKIRVDNKTGFRGVSYNPMCGKYRACVCINGKQIHLGLYESPRDAAKAYNAKAIVIFGEYARLNVV